MRMTPDEYAALVQSRATRAIEPAKRQQTHTGGLSAAVQALGRLKAGELNATEQAYADQLEAQKIAGVVAWYRFDAINLRLADHTFYKPDFFVMLATGELEVHEVKGHWTDDALVKIKVAASMYPMRFIAVRKVSKKDGGGWDIRNF